MQSTSATLHYSSLEERDQLPWHLDVEFPNHVRRRYRVYVWTVGHGGRTRSLKEYRIQTKLERTSELVFGREEITLLLGYYHAKLDSSGKAVGNNPPDDMEVIVAWDPLMHFKLGASSSCQVSFDLLEKSRRVGVAEVRRELSEGNVENVIAMRPEFFARYVLAAKSGHKSADIDSIVALDHSLVLQ